MPCGDKELVSAGGDRGCLDIYRIRLARLPRALIAPNDMDQAMKINLGVCVFHFPNPARLFFPSICEAPRYDSFTRRPMKPLHLVGVLVPAR